MSNKLAVIAIGGNSLIRDRFHRSVRDQYIAAKETCEHVSSVIRMGWKVAMAHGNGPQVGFILRRSDLAAHELHRVPLDACVADSQGAIGYALQQNLQNDFKRQDMSTQVVTVVTQVEVSIDDPALKSPTKPIGSFLTRDEALRHQEEDGWDVMEDAGRGWRRVIPSPVPIRIIEEEAIKELIRAGVVVITVGGGGIPVVRDEKDQLRGIAAVIDKDLSASLLASIIEAELFIISTDVEKVALNFTKSSPTWLDHMTLVEARSYLEAGKHFGQGSMAPKIQAAIDFLESGGKETIITNPENIERALAGETGTHITVD